MSKASPNVMRLTDGVRYPVEVRIDLSIKCYTFDDLLPAMQRAAKRRYRRRLDKVRVLSPTKFEVDL